MCLLVVHFDTVLSDFFVDSLSNAVIGVSMMKTLFVTAQ